jgi:hypothetical protein
MEIRTITALSAALLSPLATAGVSIVAIPDTPTIEAPTADAVDVSITPEISGTAASATRTGPPTVAIAVAESEDYPVSLDTAEWLFFEPQENLTLLGGYKQSSADLYTSEKTWTIPSPLNFTIDGSTVSQLSITNHGTVELLDETDAILAKVSAQPYYTSSIQSAEPNALISVKKESDTLMTITWGLASSDGADVEWTGKFQAVIETIKPTVGFKMSYSDFEDPFFTLGAETLSCYIRFSESLMGGRYKLSDLKSRHDNDSSSTSSRACFYNEASGEDFSVEGIYTSQFNTPAPSDQSLPTFLEVSTTENPHTLTSDEALEPGTKYGALLRYSMNDGDSFNAYSAWSEQIEFTTELNTEYAMSANATSAFTQGVAKTLTFTLTNNGSDAGEPRAEVRLPFNVLSGVKGTFNAAMAEGITASCNTSVIGTITTLGCTLKGLAAGESADFTATITLNDLGSQDIEYRVCETLLEGCTGASYNTLNVTVSAQASEAPGNEDDTSSSSSGGGSTFWFLLLGLPLTLLRRSR